METNGQKTINFDSWAVLELMGKVRLGGRVREEQVFNVAMIRIDIPDKDGNPVLTRYFHPNALYGVTPVSKEGAIAVAIYNQSPPVHQWEMRQLNAGEPDAVDGERWDDGHEDDDDFEDSDDD